MYVVPNIHPVNPGTSSCTSDHLTVVCHFDRLNIYFRLCPIFVFVFVFSYSFSRSPSYIYERQTHNIQEVIEKLQRCSKTISLSTARLLLQNLKQTGQSTKQNKIKVLKNFTLKFKQNKIHGNWEIVADF